MYDDGRFGTRQSVVLHVDPRANNDANEVVASHKFFTSVKVLECSARVLTKGVGTTSALNILKGTSSIGAIAVSTFTNTRMDASLTDTAFDATDTLNITSVAGTDTGVWQVTVDYMEAFS